MSQFALYILGTIGTAVLTTIVGQVTTRYLPIRRGIEVQRPTIC